jgi:hypothetical protein
VNAHRLAIVEEALLGEVGMHLHLIHGRSDSAIAKNIHQLQALNVAGTNTFGQTGLGQFFHSHPSLLIGHRVLYNFSLTGIDPFRGVGHVKGDILETNGKMNQV